MSADVWDPASVSFFFFFCTFKAARLLKKKWVKASKNPSPPDADSYILH